MSRLSSDENIFKGDFYEAEQEADMNTFGVEDEDYYFQIAENLEDDRQFILIIYDIVDNKRRTKFAKLLEGYGTRVQKSAFEAMLSQKSYEKLVREIPHQSCQWGGQCPNIPDGRKGSCEILGRCSKTAGRNCFGVKYYVALPFVNMVEYNCSGSDHEDIGSGQLYLYAKRDVIYEQDIFIFTNREYRPD